MNKIRFGIIGCGGIARWHAKAIQLLEGARLTAVTDSSPERREAFGREYGVPAVPDEKALLGRDDVDAVCICTPSGFHAGQAILALGAGKHVVAEKPFAITRETMEAVLEAERASNAQMTVISQLRFSQDVQRAKALLEEGALGKIVMADLSMKYYREPSYYENGNWRGSIAMDGGGALINQGIHGVDLLRFLCGDIKTVHAHKKTLFHHIEGEDTLYAGFEFENGALGVLTAATSCYPGQPRRLEICGTQGSMTLEESVLTRIETTGGHTLPKTGTAAVMNTSHDPFAFDISLHAKQLEQFVRSIAEGCPPALGVREAAGALGVIFAIYESAACGRIVEI
jgi:predicted dehydrogenase